MLFLAPFSYLFKSVLKFSFFCKISGRERLGMDMLAVNVKNVYSGSPFLARKSFPSPPNSCNLRDSVCRLSCLSSSFGVDDLRAFEIRPLWRKVDLFPSRHQSLLVRAKAKKNHDSSSAYGNRDRSSSNGDDINDGHKIGDPLSKRFESHRVNLDWREFRANLFAREQAEEFVGHNQMASRLESSGHGLKWAHPIAVPETGCILVATEKLDGVRTFERTVILLLRSGARQREEGPFGIVINRPLHKKMKPTNPDIAATFSDCSLHFGGPLDAGVFLLKMGEKPKVHSFQDVVSGLCFGSRNCLDEAVGLVKKGILKPWDFRFFAGYAGWQYEQLREEIESDYWHVAACSSNLIFGSSSSSAGLWEEILQLMGGHYSELSKKPKQDQ